MAKLAAVDAGRLARKSRPGRRLDVHLHQLAAHASLCPRLGREIQGSGLGGDRRAQPEFAFEKNVDNVRRAAQEMRVIIRSRSITTLRYGVLSRTSIGPPSISSMRRDAFDITSSARANTNSRNGPFSNCWPRPEDDGIGRELVSVDAHGVEAAADWGSLKSPENYVGYERTENFASPGGAASDQRRVYAVPARLRLNQWALSGDWTMTKRPPC